MTILIYKRDGTVQVLEEFRKMYIGRDTLEAERAVFISAGESEITQIDRSTIIKVEVLL